MQNTQNQKGGNDLKENGSQQPIDKNKKLHESQDQGRTTPGTGYSQGPAARDDTRVRETINRS